MDAVKAATDPESARSWRLTKAAVFLLIGVGAIVWLVVDQRRAAMQQELRRTGAAIAGRVTDLEVRRGGQILQLSYAFTANGRSIEVRDRKVGDFDGLQKHGPIMVWYDPADPNRCVTDPELHGARFGWTPFLFVGLIVIMMGFAAWQARQVIQPKRDPPLGE